MHFVRVTASARLIIAYMFVCKSIPRCSSIFTAIQWIFVEPAGQQDKIIFGYYIIIQFVYWEPYVQMSTPPMHVVTSRIRDLPTWHVDIDIDIDIDIDVDHNLVSMLFCIDQSWKPRGKVYRKIPDGYMWTRVHM